jgi:hypothetical protein
MESTKPEDAAVYDERNLVVVTHLPVPMLDQCPGSGRCSASGSADHHQDPGRAG